MLPKGAAVIMPGHPLLPGLVAEEDHDAKAFILDQEHLAQTLPEFAAGLVERKALRQCTDALAVSEPERCAPAEPKRSLFERIRLPLEIAGAVAILVGGIALGWAAADRR